MIDLLEDYAEGISRELGLDEKYMQVDVVSAIMCTRVYNAIKKEVAEMHGL